MILLYRAEFKLQLAESFEHAWSMRYIYIYIYIYTHYADLRTRLGDTQPSGVGQVMPPKIVRYEHVALARHTSASAFL